MTIDWSFFITELVSNPLLMVVTLLNIGVIIVNGIPLELTRSTARGRWGR